MRHIISSFTLAILIVSLLFGVTLASGVYAQQTPLNDFILGGDTSIFPAKGGAPVVVDGQELFIIRGTSAFSATRRADEIGMQIIRHAEVSHALSLKMETRPDPFGTAIYADGTKIMVTTAEDAVFEATELNKLVALQSNAIERAILDFRRVRSTDARFDSIMSIGLMTAIFAVFLGVLYIISSRIPNMLTHIIERRMVDGNVASASVSRYRAIIELMQFLVRIVIMILVALSLYYYISAVLFSFAETRVFASILIKYVTDPIFTILESVVNYLPNLLVLGVIAFFTRHLIKLLKVVFQNIEAGTLALDDFQPNWIWPTFNIMRGVLVIFALVLAFPYIPGSDSAAFRGMTLVVGVMVSLGSNSVVANVLAGLFVIYRRSTNIGDRIRIGDHVGDVVAIKLMETYLKSTKNELISIPNAQLLNSEVINYSSKIDKKDIIAHTSVGIGYEEPRGKITELLLEAAARSPQIKKSPKPFVLRTALTDFSITYQVNGYIQDGAKMQRILSELHDNILDVFNESNVQIMTPHYMADPKQPKIPS